MTVPAITLKGLDHVVLRVRAAPTEEEAMDISLDASKYEKMRRTNVLRQSAANATHQVSNRLQRASGFTVGLLSPIQMLNGGAPRSGPRSKGVSTVAVA